MPDKYYKDFDSDLEEKFRGEPRDHDLDIELERRGYEIEDGELIHPSEVYEREFENDNDDPDDDNPFVGFIFLVFFIIVSCALINREWTGHMLSYIASHVYDWLAEHFS